MSGDTVEPTANATVTGESEFEETPSSKLIEFEGSHWFQKRELVCLDDKF